MGMGDCVLEILLREKGLLGESVSQKELDYFVAFAEGHGGGTVYRIASELRSRGFSAAFSYKTKAGLSKQFKEASAQNAKKCIIVGDEFREKKLTVKDMTTGEQELVDYETFLSGLDSRNK
jgi:histidyl-tRNA synthetase